MRKVVLSLVLSVGVIAVSCGGGGVSPAPPPPPAPPEEAPAPAPEPEEPIAEPETVTDSLIVADFNGADRVNNLGGEFGAWASSEGQPEATCEDLLEAGSGTDGSQAWRINYDISNEGSYCGTWLRLNDLDARPYTTLKLDLRGGDPHATSLIIELKANGGERVSRYTISGITGDWRTIEIPLASFGELGEPNPLYELTTVIDPSVAASVPVGAFYIDNVTFE